MNFEKHQQIQETIDLLHKNLSHFSTSNFGEKSFLYVLCPWFWWCRFLIRIYVRAGSHWSTKFMSQKTLETHPNDAGYIDTLSEIHYVRGNINDAIKNIQKAIQLDPNDAYYKQQLWKFKNVKLQPIG